MSDQRPNLVPVSPNMGGRGLPLLPRTVVVAAVVALVAFLAGLQLSPTREVVVPAPSPSAPASSPPAAPATPAPAAGLATAAPPLPLGVYHLTQPEANEIAVAVRFYAAYNAGQLATVMALLSAQPHLFDCDYTTQAAMILTGRSVIETYLRARFAEHDRWTVEFYQANPANNREVVVLPLQRSNDTLRRLGAPGGAKRSFPEDFYLAFNPDRVHLDAIAWYTMSGSGGLCSP